MRRRPGQPAQPAAAPRAAGAIVAPKPGHIQGWRHHDKGAAVAVDRRLDQARPDDHAALLLPGGVINPDALRIEPQAIAFIRHFVQARKPIGAICHGPWTLIDAGGVGGRTMTSWPSLQADPRNAGSGVAQPPRPRRRHGAPVGAHVAMSQQIGG